MKFGGTSVGSSERIGAVAERVATAIEAGSSVVVVVSAMSGETDRLIELGRKVGGDCSKGREYHQLLTAGEHASCALTAMALRRRGYQARSLLAHQLKLQTRSVYGQNLIDSIDSNVLRTMFEQKIVPVVAGFQGVDETGDYTTLGRGGSDTTAVALAASLGACRCEILTDIDGVYSAPPSICKKARKLESVTYEEMLEIASGGAKVLQARSVSLAQKHKVPVVVLSSFRNISGTEITEGYEGMEDAVVSSITCRTDEARLTIRNISEKPGAIAAVFRALNDAEVLVDMIVQSKGIDGRTVVGFTVSKGSAISAYETLTALVNDTMADASIELDKGIAKLSIVGEGMRTHAGVASKMFAVLGKEEINVDMITTSEIKISVVIEEKYCDEAVRLLHEAFIESDETT